jgi:hypothetical protein
MRISHNAALVFLESLIGCTIQTLLLDVQVSRF